MRQMKRKVAATLIVAAAGVALTHGTSNASPSGHQVTYTVTAANALFAHVYYMATEPPSMTAYADNTAKYLWSTRPRVNSDAPWSYTTTLADPSQWATVSAYNHFAETDQPPDAPGVDAKFHCQIVIDGQVVVSHQGDRSVECTMRQW
jgi:hypothetical protein